MNKVTFNNLINLECPEGFVELSERENQRYFSSDLLRLSFQNKDTHVLLSLSKTKNSFINWITNAASVAHGSLANMANNLKDYQFIEEYESTVFRKQAITECFSYIANDQNIKQYGELTVFKIKNAFYVIYCLCRLEDKEEHQSLFKQFRDSFSPISA